MNHEESSSPGPPDPEATRSADGLLVEQARQGNAEAGHRFFREHYPSVYRYLLWLTGHPDTAEDLAQETFVRAWRSLHTFDDRAPLRPWLYRIAHREFLRALRSRKAETSLEEIGDVAGPRAMEWAEAVELRDAIRKLPAEEGEIVILHYLEGYRCEEIAPIVRMPTGTVKYRLSEARSHLRRALGEGDLTYLNEQPVSLRQWAWLPLDRIADLETHLRGAPRGDEAALPSSGGDPSADAGQIAATTGMVAGRDADVVDDRLDRKVSLAVKAIALSDLCDRLREETGIAIVAGPSVADEKVTIFCRQAPLREVMRQLSRPFGYSWRRGAPRLRRGGASSPGGVGAAPGIYHYELVQEIRSQLLEEELRNRDRGAALVALEQEIERYRPYLDLSPDEALARVGEASPPEKELLTKLAGFGWGPVQMYFRLSSQELTALRAGETLTFSAAPRPDERPLPPDVAHGVLQSFRDWRFTRLPRGLAFTPLERPDAIPATEVPEARAHVTLRIQQSEPGQFIFDGSSGVFAVTGPPKVLFTQLTHGPYAVGKNLFVRRGERRRANPRLAGDTALRRRISLDLEAGNPAGSAADHDAPGSPPEPGAAPVTSADALEALHRTTGLNVVGDYYTALHVPALLSVRDKTLADALDQLADGLGLRWREEDGWLQLRSVSFYHDRLKEVPNHLLERWASARRPGAHGTPSTGEAAEGRGTLSLDDLIEIARLPDAQLDAESMAEGARARFGLAEWDLARNRNLRPHLRYLAQFTPAQRQAATSATGLPFTEMSPAQQQGFLAFAPSPWDESAYSPAELAEAVLRVDYTQPGGFQWGDPGEFQHWFSWVVPIELGLEGRRVLRPPVRERTREAALEAVRRLDPGLRAAAVQTLREWLELPGGTAETAPIESQIFPTALHLTIVYVPSAANARFMRMVSDNVNNWQPSC